MIGELYAGYKGFSTIVGLGKQLLDVKDAAARNSLIIDFTGKLMEAQQHEALLIERIRELEKSLMRFENWEAEKQRYKLKPLGKHRVLAYVLDPMMANGDPPHAICANCYQNGQKSFLQATSSRSYGLSLKCNKCGADQHTGFESIPEIGATYS
ncbi:hypothetical protein [uncultured Hoeflea sp.]|uniref:hypothetical protein n=1 Tax=uncultured Hoeflea sp. TaxID=538666 RepID=UPI0030DCFBAE